MGFRHSQIEGQVHVCAIKSFLLTAKSTHSPAYKAALNILNVTINVICIRKLSAHRQFVMADFYLRVLEDGNP